jgi:hypothetical protein
MKNKKEKRKTYPEKTFFPKTSGKQEEERDDMFLFL